MWQINSLEYHIFGHVTTVKKKKKGGMIWIDATQSYHFPYSHISHCFTCNFKFVSKSHFFLTIYIFKTSWFLLSTININFLTSLYFVILLFKLMRKKNKHIPHKLLRLSHGGRTYWLVPLLSPETGDFYYC